MSGERTSLIHDQLSKETLVFGLHLWVVVGFSVGAAMVILFFLISLWLIYRRNSLYPVFWTPPPTVPFPSTEISGVNKNHIAATNSTGNQGNNNGMNSQDLDKTNGIDAEVEKAGLRVPHSDRFAVDASGDQVAATCHEVSHLGWGHWYTLRELEVATNGFSAANVIGEGGYGIVYHGVLGDNTQVAVKNLLNNNGQAEKEFKVEVEAIGRVRHKCLVKLLGYCAARAHRMLVYEYVDNGNLEQWLHGDVGSVSPLTWEIRMNIILGTAKGLAYLHEGLEPKVVHRDIKSSNILLDKQWNAKVSDFGLAKLLGSDNSYITTRVMGTFGYVSPEYASTGMLNERSDVYSFGILVMEIFTGRNPVDHSRPPGEINLVDWLKMMVASRNLEGILDPRMQEKPAPKALKRSLLIALRCIDPNALKRPKMGQVVHMLEAEDSSFTDDHTGRRNILRTRSLHYQESIS